MEAAISQVEAFTTGSIDRDRPLYLLRSSPREPSQRRPVLLLHGSTLPGSVAYTVAFDGKSWLSDLAGRGRDAWVLDFRGYGRSWKPADDGARPCAPVADTAQAVSDLAIAVCYVQDRTGADGVDLVGWSWGATVAAAYAASTPMRGRLVLHAPQWLRDTPSPMVTPQTLSEPYRKVDVPAFVERWQARIAPDLRATLQPWRRALERTLQEHEPIFVPNGSARDIASQWMAGRPAYDPSRITAPTLVVVGSADTDTPPALANEVFRRLGATDKTYREVPQGTHFTVFEPAREALFRITAEFLAVPDMQVQETYR